MAFVFVIVFYCNCVFLVYIIFSFGIILDTVRVYIVLKTFAALKLVVVHSECKTIFVVW